MLHQDRRLRQQVRPRRYEDVRSRFLRMFSSTKMHGIAYYKTVSRALS